MRALHGDTEAVARRLGQQGLWGFGISGDCPSSFCGSRKRRTCRPCGCSCAYGYLALKGLRVDLVLLNDHPASYLDALNEQVRHSSAPATTTAGKQARRRVSAGPPSQTR